MGDKQMPQRDAVSAVKLSQIEYVILALLREACGFAAIPHDDIAATLATIEWEVLLEEAGRQGVQPLICRQLEKLATLPFAIRTLIKQRQRSLVLRNLQMTSELWAIIEYCNANQIQVIPFKGPTLAALIEDDLAWRSFGDLDLLIARESVARASTLLKQNGYELQLDWAACQDPRFWEVTYTLEFFHRLSGYMVELHWELFPRYFGFAFPVNELKERLINIQVGGQRMATLAPPDLLLYLCAHGAKHSWAGLNHVVDVARLIKQKTDWDWPALWKDAQQRNVAKSLLLGVWLAHTLLAVTIPVWLIELVESDSALFRLAHTTRDSMFQPTTMASGMWRQFTYFFQLQQGWRSRCLYLMRLVVSPNVGDWEFKPLAHQWLWLYVVLRPIRLLKKYAPLLLKRS